MKILNIFRRKEYLLGLIIIVINLYIKNLSFHLIIHEPTKKVFTTSLYYVILHYLVYVFLESEFDSIFFKILQVKLEKIMSYISIIAIIFLSLIIGYGSSLYSMEYLLYKQFCPYTLSGLDYKLHFKRRCELYYIDKEKIYPFRYICSCNEEKNIFIPEKYLNEYFAFNYSDVECSKVKKLIDNNKVIDEFVNEYHKEDLYYCVLRTQVKKFSKSIISRKCDDKMFPLKGFNIIYFILVSIYINWEFTYFKNIKANIVKRLNYTHLILDKLY